MACTPSHCASVCIDSCITNAPPGTPTAFGTANIGDLIDDSHITALRVAINNERARRGDGASGWTDSPLSAGINIKAVHPTEIKNAINSANQYANQPCTADGGCPSDTSNPDWFNNPASDTYSIGGVIVATDINNLRTWVNGLEGSCVCNTDCNTHVICACFGDCGCNYT